MLDDASVFLRAALAPIELMWSCFELVVDARAEDRASRPVRTVFRYVVVLVAMILGSVVGGLAVLMMLLTGWVSAWAILAATIGCGLLAGFAAIWWMSRA